MLLITFINNLLAAITIVTALPSKVNAEAAADGTVATSPNEIEESVMAAHNISARDNSWPAFTTYSKPGCLGDTITSDFEHRLPPDQCADAPIVSRRFYQGAHHVD